MPEVTENTYHCLIQHAKAYYQNIGEKNKVKTSIYEQWQ